MRRLLVLSLITIGCTSPPPINFSTPVDVEFILDDNGDAIIFKDTHDRQMVWAEILIRGTHPKFPFVDSLYNKYFYRALMVKGQTKLDTVAPGGMNFRTHQTSQDSIIRALDMIKVPLSSALLQARLDILDVPAITSLIENDEVEDKLEIEFWPWGTKERKEFVTMSVTTTIGMLDSIRADSVNWYINPLFLRDSLIVLGKPLRTLTIGNVANSSVSTKFKQWFQQKVRQPNPDIKMNTTIWQLLVNYRGKIPMFFMRHPEFRKVAKRWLKRRSQ